MHIVADASVALKWFLPAERSDDDGNKALALLSGFRNNQFSLLQPPHWLAEVAAVLCRVSPTTVEDDIALLIAMRIPEIDSGHVYAMACRLAIESKEHVFDTLYHAVALLSAESTLITADERYYRKARKFGSISLLRDFRITPTAQG